MRSASFVLTSGCVAGRLTKGYLWVLEKRGRIVGLNVNAYMSGWRRWITRPIQLHLRLTPTSDSGELHFRAPSGL